MAVILEPSIKGQPSRQNVRDNETILYVRDVWKPTRIYAETNESSRSVNESQTRHAACPWCQSQLSFTLYNCGAVSKTDMEHEGTFFWGNTATYDGWINDEIHARYGNRIV
jgi:hypothetical protein